MVLIGGWPSVPPNNISTEVYEVGLGSLQIFILKKGYTF
jgi:hypothetical protein